MTITWSEAVDLARDVLSGTGMSPARSAVALASYVVAEQAAIEEALAEAKTLPEVEDLELEPVPQPPRVTLPFISRDPPSDVEVVAGEPDEFDEDDVAP